MGILGTAHIIFNHILLYIPPFTAPDEGHHYFSTYWLVDSLPFNAHVTNDGAFLVRDIDYALYNSRQPGDAINSASFDSVIDGFSLFGNGQLVPFSEFSF